MYPSIDDDDDLLAALCFDQSNGAEDPYGYIETDQENIFPDFGSSGVNLQAGEEQLCNIGDQFDSFSRNLPEICSVRVENNDLGSCGGFGSTQLDLAASFSGVLQQEQPLQICSVRANDVQQEPEQVCSGVVEINSSSSVGTVKRELEHVEEECSRKRGRTGSCSKPGTKACREKLRREKLNDRFMDLSSILEPGRTPKTDKSAIIDDAIRDVNKLRGEIHELKETNQELLEEIKSLKAEKNELREEKLVLKAEKEKMEQQMKSMAVPSQPGFMASHPAAAFHHNKMAVYASYGYYPNMQMWQPPYMQPKDRDTAHDEKNVSPIA